MSFGRRGFNNNNNNSNNGSNLAARFGQTSTLMEIKGWEGGTKESFVSWMQRKANVKLNNIQQNGSVLTCTVKSQDARKLAAYSGSRFAGAALSISILDEDGGSDLSGSTPATIDMLRKFLEMRFVGPNKLLNLDGLPNDQYLVQNGLFSSASTSSRMFPALMKIAQQNIPESAVESVSLASNNLRDISNISSLAQTFPNLKNLNLAGNNITSTSALDVWRHKMRSLRELILTGNPMTNHSSYKADIMRLFPSLMMLDGVVVRTEAEIQSRMLKLPMPVKQLFFENDGIQGVVGPFLAQFLELYDNRRDDLLVLYDAQSTFSLSLCTASPRVLFSQNTANWGPYITLSRNMMKITTTDARIRRLSIGPQAIQRTFSKIPKSKHDLSQSQNYSIEAWQTQGVREPNDTGLVCVVHGEFMEGNTKRSFDRTLVILPGPNGGMIVCTDMLVIRPWAGSDAWKETPQSQAASPSPAPAGVPTPSVTPVPGAGLGVAAPIAVDPALQGLNPQQLEVVQRFVAESPLNAKYARMCCEQANFDYGNAVKLFEQFKSTLPPDAFKPM